MPFAIVVCSCVFINNFCINYTCERDSVSEREKVERGYKAMFYIVILIVYYCYINTNGSSHLFDFLSSNAQQQLMRNVRQERVKCHCSFET